MPSRARGSVTQQQIADVCGVSKATVSYVLNGRAPELKITPAVAERVQRTARELGYCIDHLSRSFASGRSSTIGVTIPADGMLHRYWSTLIAGIDEYARSHATNLLLIGPSEEETVLECGLRYLRERRIDGLVVGPGCGRVDPQRIEAGLPLVQLTGDSGGAHANGVTTIALDPGPGIEAAITHLAAQGHRRVCWLSITVDGVRAVSERTRYAEHFALDQDLDLQVVDIECPLARGPDVDEWIAAYLGALDGFELPTGVTAVCCYNDTMAMALGEVLRRHGLRIPADVALVGFDDIHASHALPPLTTISHELPALGAAAAAAVMRLADGRRPPANLIRVPTRLRVRASTGATLEAGTRAEHGKKVS